MVENGPLVSEKCKFNLHMYVGHPISSDNGLISQKLLLNSEFYFPLHLAMGVAYLCLKYEVFSTT